MANKNSQMYRKWVNQGWIRVTKSDCIDYDQIRDDILKDSEQFNIKLIGFDVWNATQLRTQLQNIGLDVEPFPQTYARYSPTSKTAEEFISRKRINHNGDPVLSWAVGNVVIETDANANIKPNKKKAVNKIDPAVAILMSFGTYSSTAKSIFPLSDEKKQMLDEFKLIEL